MRLTVPVTTGHIKSGIQARSADLGLVGHGEDRCEALESLRKAVSAWVNSLDRRNQLVAALHRAGLEQESEVVGLEVVFTENSGPAEWGAQAADGG